MGGLSRIGAILSMIFPFRLVWYLPLKRTRNVYFQTCDRTNHCRQKIYPSYLPGRLRIEKNLFDNAKIEHLHGLDGQSSVRDQLMTFLAAGHETTPYANDLGHSLPMLAGKWRYPIPPLCRNPSCIFLPPVDDYYI